MFNWFTRYRRKKLSRAVFPPLWEEIIRRNVIHYCNLDSAEQSRLRSLVQIFMAEKNWVGAGGLELTDEIKVTVSAQACILVLCLPHDYYRNVESIIIYPSTVILPRRNPGFFEIPSSPQEPSKPIIGQAFVRGPVILVWDAALRGGRHPESGHNVVYHEFAHKLDMLDGMADGTPPLKDRAEYHDWVQICSQEYLRLKEKSRKGKKNVSGRLWGNQ